mmetsp:Transcript_62855/g.175136  ORF Transcript_62855/g.175136 Transcript_62855/m.175136 type:complete len:268 (-) Transcript_62855:83-886(-)
MGETGSVVTLFEKDTSLSCRNSFCISAIRSCIAAISPCPSDSLSAFSIATPSSSSSPQVARTACWLQTQQAYRSLDSMDSWSCLSVRLKLSFSRSTSGTLSLRCSSMMLSILRICSSSIRFSTNQHSRWDLISDNNCDAARSPCSLTGVVSSERACLTCDKTLRSVCDSCRLLRLCCSNWMTWRRTVSAGDVSSSPPTPFCMYTETPTSKLRSSWVRFSWTRLTCLSNISCTSSLMPAEGADGTARSATMSTGRRRSAKNAVKQLQP